MQWTHKISGYIALDITLTCLVLVITGLRFHHQRRLKLDPLPKTYLVGNVALVLGNLFILTWTIVNTRARVQLLKWLVNPVGLSPVQVDPTSTFFRLGGYWYVFTLWFIKTAFLSTYFRIVPYCNRWARGVLWMTVVIVFLAFVGSISLHALYCLPLNVPCMSWMTTVNMISDIALLIVPLMVLREIRLGTVAWWSLCFVYFVGGISILASFVRYLFIRRYILADDIYEAIALNETIEVWNAVEYCTASIAFCLPSLRSLWRRKTNTPTAAGELASYVSGERTTTGDRESGKSQGDMSSSNCTLASWRGNTGKTGGDGNGNGGGGRGDGEKVEVAIVIGLAPRPISA